MNRILAAIVGLVIMLMVCGWLSDRTTVPGQSMMKKPAAALMEIASQALRLAVGDRPAKYEAVGFEYDRDALVRGQRRAAVGVAWAGGREATGDPLLASHKPRADRSARRLWLHLAGGSAAGAGRRHRDGARH